MALFEEDFDTTIKIIVVGNGGIGKTSLIQKFAKGIFTDVYKKTIGVDFLEKKLFVPALQQDVTLFLWDTAGQEEFDSVTRAYYRDAGACVIAFSTTDRASFEDVGKWKRKVETECGKIPMVLIQNKIDLIDQAVMTKEEAEKTAAELGLRFYRTCVKEGVNVAEVFLYLAEQAVHAAKEQALAQPVAAIGFTRPADSMAGASAAASGAVPATPGGPGVAAPSTPAPQAVPVTPVALPSTPAPRSGTISLTAEPVKPSKQRGSKKFTCMLL